MKTTFALCTALLLTTFGPAAAAPLGSAFTYQGYLTDGTGPANNLYEFQFSLFDAVTGGNVVGTPVNLAPVPVSNGLFTAVLDFGPNAFAGDEGWLEITFSVYGSDMIPITLKPRQPVTPTPYAIRALSFSGTVVANQLTGTISSNNIGAGTITTIMLAAGAVGSNQLAAGAVTTDALANGAVTAAKTATVTVPRSLTTFTNPMPARGDIFGFSLTAVGTDRVLIGAPWHGTSAENDGAAYLFSTNGALLTTFTNPTPAVGDGFGWSVAAVGIDRVLIGAFFDDTGATDAGTAYLFDINGALLTTITNPTPAFGDQFGYSVTGVGIDRLLVGEPHDHTSGNDAGAAYLFSTNGALLATFTNPTPAGGDWFGVSVAAAGDWVLIGAYQDDTGQWGWDAGAAYLFSTNGALLTTFTNPTLAAGGYFGYSVAALGTDRVLIGAFGTGTAAAYLFSTNGASLATFANPMPASSGSFGVSVAAVGTDHVLIGAPEDNTGARSAGAAYLFNTNGALLTTFPNPTPAIYDRFGISVAAAGSDSVLVGAYGDDTGASNAGAVYLISLETYTPGLIADGVRHGSITSTSLDDGAVTLPKLDPAFGIWTRAGDDVFRLAGSVGIGTSSFTSNRLEVAGMVGALAFNTTSDRAAKQDISAVDAQAVLTKVAALPIMQWRFKEIPGALHLGPMAQDFRAAFGLGVDDESIATVDADGVALAAIKGLNQKLEAELERRDAESAELKRRLSQLEQLILQSHLNSGQRQP